MGRDLDGNIWYTYCFWFEKEGKICLEPWYGLGIYDDNQCSDPRRIRGAYSGMVECMPADIFVLDPGIDSTTESSNKKKGIFLKCSFVQVII